MKRQRNYPADRIRPGTPTGERILHYAVPRANGCWQWSALCDKAGYGYLAIRSVPKLAHRLSYETFVGPIPDGLHIDHLCRNRACVNPDHLEAVTPEENRRRANVQPRKTQPHCPRGHEYESNGARRVCRPCNRARSIAWQSMTSEERAARKAAGLPIVDLDAYFAEQVPA